MSSNSHIAFPLLTSIRESNSSCFLLSRGSVSVRFRGKWHVFVPRDETLKPTSRMKLVAPAPNIIFHTRGNPNAAMMGNRPSLDFTLIFAVRGTPKTLKNYTPLSSTFVRLHEEKAVTNFPRCPRLAEKESRLATWSSRRTLQHHDIFLLLGLFFLPFPAWPAPPTVDADPKSSFLARSSHAAMCSQPPIVSPRAVSRPVVYPLQMRPDFVALLRMRCGSRNTGNAGALAVAAGRTGHLSISHLRCSVDPSTNPRGRGITVTSP